MIEDFLSDAARKAYAGYWTKRKDYVYYSSVLSIVRRMFPDARSAIDVGAHETEILSQMDWIPRRVAIDLQPCSAQPGVERVVGDFLEYAPSEPFDLVLCLQLLEHLRDPKRFADKLFASGRSVVISIPYKWPAGMCMSHCQDPVDEEKLYRWTGRVPVFQEVAKDRFHRLISVY